MSDPNFQRGPCRCVLGAIGPDDTFIIKRGDFVWRLPLPLHIDVICPHGYLHRLDLAPGEQRMVTLLNRPADAVEETPVVGTKTG